MLIMMSVFKSDEVSNFLNTREPSKALIEVIVNIIPDREFYYPEIEAEQLSAYREDINELIVTARSLKSAYSGMNAKLLQKEYHDELKQLVTRKRKLLIFGILMQSDSSRRDILYRIVKSYRLQKRVLALKEVFRE